MNLPVICENCHAELLATFTNMGVKVQPCECKGEEQEASPHIVDSSKPTNIPCYFCDAIKPKDVWEAMHWHRYPVGSKNGSKVWVCPLCIANRDNFKNIRTYSPSSIPTDEGDTILT